MTTVGIQHDGHWYTVTAAWVDDRIKILSVDCRYPGDIPEGLKATIRGVITRVPIQRPGQQDTNTSKEPS